MRGIDERKREILERATAEMHAARGYALPVHMDLATALAVVGALQLALRHPANTGPSSEAVRGVIAAVIQRIEEDGFPSLAGLARLGDNPTFDE
jgi:hypothetical protein